MNLDAVHHVPKQAVPLPNHHQSMKRVIIIIDLLNKGRVTVLPFFGPRWIWLKFEYMVV